MQATTVDTDGNVRTRDGSPPLTPWSWPGQEQDVHSQSVYNRARWYDPASGRYLSPDPLRLHGGLAVYGYPDDPLSSVDPLGLAGCRVVNSNMPHASERAVERAGFATEKEAREALQQFGAEMEASGIPGSAIADTAHVDRIIVPGSGQEAPSCTRSRMMF